MVGRRGGECALNDFAKAWSPFPDQLGALWEWFLHPSCLVFMGLECLEKRKGRKWQLQTVEYFPSTFFQAMINFCSSRCKQYKHYLECWPSGSPVGHLYPSPNYIWLPSSQHAWRLISHLLYIWFFVHPPAQVPVDRNCCGTAAIHWLTSCGTCGHLWKLRNFSCLNRYLLP